MNPTKKQARTAGFLYLLTLIGGPIGLIYVPNKIMVTGDATATADHLRASESLLRIGIGSELIVQIVWIFVVLALYRLFKAVNETQAWLMVILGAFVSVPIVCLNVVNEVAALVLVSGATFVSAFSKPQLDALTFLFLRLHGQGLTVAAIFWGLWLFPFGTLIIQSRFIPRFLGFLLIIAGVAYVVDAFTVLVLPSYRHLTDQFVAPFEAGELPIIFWLLIWGTRDRPSVGTAPIKQ